MHKVVLALTLACARVINQYVICDQIQENPPYGIFCAIAVYNS